MKPATRNRTSYTVWNETDGIYATPDTFRTRRNAQKFVRTFMRRFIAQGFYRTNSGERIALNEVALQIVEVEGDTEE